MKPGQAPRGGGGSHLPGSSAGPHWIGPTTFFRERERRRTGVRMLRSTCCRVPDGTGDLRAGGHSQPDRPSPRARTRAASAARGRAPFRLRGTSMKTPFRWYLPRGAATAVGVAVAVLACTDRSNPVSPGDEDPGGPVVSTPAIPLAMLDCSASVANRTVSCGPPSTAPKDARGDILYGGQDVFVVSTTSSVNYDAGTQ